MDEQHSSGCDSGAPESGNSMSITMDADAELQVTNTKTGILPTGTEQHPVRTAFLLTGLLTAISVLLMKRRRGAGQDD